MNKTVEYALYGALFGALFPLISTVFDLLVQGVPFTLSNALQLQRSQPLHWVIDSAPLFLGLFAGLAGRRQDTVIAKVQELTSLNQRLQQEQKNLADLAGGLQQLFENMPLGAAAFGQDNVLLSANGAFQRFVAGDQGIQQALDHHIAVLDSDQMSRDIKLESGESAKYAMVWRVDLPGLGDTRYWVLLNDQTAQKVSEAQLKMTSKLATLGELAAGTAHELNQPLNHIKLLAANMTNIMKRSPADLDALQAKVEAVSASTTRAGKIIAHMLSFGRSSSDRMQPMFVGTAIEAALGLLQHQFIEHDIRVEVALEPSLPAIMGVENQLEQVFINLIGNGIDAIAESSPADRLISVSANLQGDTVGISIRDTGGGLTDIQLEKLFEPFFTTKEVGKGTGLGGSISYGIVTGFGGNITASNWEQGTEITLSFPISQPEPQAKPELQDPV